MRSLMKERQKTAGPGSKAAHERQELSRKVFEEAPCYITVHDPEYRLVDMNRLFKRDFGGWPGDYCYRVYKHRSEPCVPCPVMETFLDGKPHSSEEVVTTMDGRRRHILVQTAPLLDRDDNVSTVMEMSTDITTIRDLQGQLSDLGILISSISHTVKGILAGLDSGIYLVDSGFEKGRHDRIERGWEIVRRNVRRIKSTVLDILYYAKERPLELRRLEAVALYNEVKGLAAPRAAEQAIDWEESIDQEAGTFTGDHEALRAMLVNIVENSIDACRVDDRKETHRIRFVVTGEPDYVIFQIADNGLGMDRETREKAFSLFYSSKGPRGTGLGLFMANKIVTSHRGVIHLESDFGVGTCFTVKLPRVSPAGAC